MQNIIAIEQDLAAFDLAISSQQTQNCPHQGTLSRTAFTDNPENPALWHSHVYIAQSMDIALRGFEIYIQTGNFENGFHSLSV